MTVTCEKSHETRRKGDKQRKREWVTPKGRDQAVSVAAQCGCDVEVDWYIGERGIYRRVAAYCGCKGVDYNRGVN